MKLQKTTLILVGLALALGTFVYFSEIKDEPELVTNQNKRAKIFDFKEDEIKQLIIETEAETLQFERTENAESTWQMKQPEDTPANDGVVVFLLNLLVKGKSERAFTTANNLSQYGLQPPFAKITVILNNNKEYKLLLGKPDFENKLIYATKDFNFDRQQNREILLVSKNFQYAIIERSLADWKREE